MEEPRQRRRFALRAVLLRSRASRSAKNHREVFNVPGTRETVDRGIRVTRFNGLFHWAVPSGMEIQAGSEVGRHEILTHCYWREAGPEFGNVNIMAVAHGTEKQRLLDHKTAIDAHLAACGIPVSYTNVFWGGRSEIKPSEISPIAYREWLQRREGKTSTSQERSATTQS